MKNQSVTGYSIAQESLYELLIDGLLTMQKKYERYLSRQDQMPNH